MKHVVFSDNSKGKSLTSAPFGSSVPFGIVHRYSRTVSSTLLAFNHALFLGLYLYDFCFDLIVTSTIGYEKIRYD